MIIAIYSLTCDGAGCHATHRAPATDSGSWPALLAAARSSGWLTRAASGQRRELHLCPPCKAQVVADDASARRTVRSRGQVHAGRTARPASTDEEK